MNAVHFLGDVFGDRLQLPTILDQLDIEPHMVLYADLFEHWRPNVVIVAILANALFDERNPGQHLLHKQDRNAQQTVNVVPFGGLAKFEVHRARIH